MTNDIVQARQPGRLLDLQQRYRELGRLRMGRQVPAGNGGMRPEKLKTWRLTSPSRRLLEAVAAIYGGTVGVWEGAPQEGTTYEVITESDSLRVAVPPGEVLTQFYELWKKGGCKKRCDGLHQILVDRACSCPRELAERQAKAQKGEACSPATRFSVVLPEVPDLGTWRLETHGYNAAAELASVYDILRTAADKGTIIPAVLRMESRSAVKDGKPISRFVVPVLEVEALPEDVARAMFQLPTGDESQEPREGVGPPVERRSLPGGAPPVSTDAGQPTTPQAVEHGSMPGDPPPIGNGNGVPAWLMDLPGDDGSICDVAMEVAAESGQTVVMETLADVGRLATSPESQAEISRRVRERFGAEPPDAEGEEPTQGELT